jgi:hypothetical protein
MSIEYEFKLKNQYKKIYNNFGTIKFWNFEKIVIFMTIGTLL